MQPEKTSNAKRRDAKYSAVRSYSIANTRTQKADSTQQTAESIQQQTAEHR
jgi:hypothetical protein